MFVGHYSAAFLAKGAEPRVPLWMLFVAAQLVDIFWDVLVLLGVEKLRIVPGITAANPLDLYYMPYTHSLLATVLWCTSTFLACRWMGLAARSAAAVALVVGSHWFLDLLVHRPDLPLFGDQMKVGLGMWNAPLVEFALEIALLCGTIGLCLRPPTPPRQRRRLLLLGGLLLLIQTITTFGPPPTSPTGVVLAALCVYVVLAVVAGRVDAAPMK